jgi:hypothetical protein
MEEETKVKLTLLDGKNLGNEKVQERGLVNFSRKRKKIKRQI